MGRRAKIGWRRAFLRALVRTGNVALAARTAGVDKGTAYNARHRDCGFARDWGRAKAFADARLAAAMRGEGGDGRVPSDRASTGSVGGEGGPGLASSLVVRFNKRDGAQLVRAGEGRWSNLVEAWFESALEATANVRAAAAAAGISTTALYKRGKRYPLLEAKWRAARETGCRTISLMLIDAAQAALDPAVEAEAKANLPQVSVADAIAVLRLHRFGEPEAPTHAGERHASRQRRQAVEDMPLEAVRDEIMRRIDAIRAHEARAGEAGDDGDRYVPVPEEEGTGTYVSPDEPEGEAR